ARAFLADPAVLVLDEATSSLDIPSERAVQSALRTVLAERTALIIAHRLSTVLIADRVLVIDAGRIIEDRSPETPIAENGAFADLHQAWRNSLAYPPHPACGAFHRACGAIGPACGAIRPACGAIRPACGAIRRACGAFHPRVWRVSPGVWRD